MPSAKWASNEGKHQTLVLPSVARLQRLAMSQGMVAHSSTGAGVGAQRYLSIGCHGSPMDASCREVWDDWELIPVEYVH